MGILEVGEAFLQAAFEEIEAGADITAQGGAGRLPQYIEKRDGALQALVARYGISCYAIRGEDNETYYEHLNAAAPGQEFLITFDIVNEIEHLVGGIGNHHRFNYDCHFSLFTTVPFANAAPESYSGGLAGAGPIE